MNQAVLRGREHEILGAVSTIAEGRCAIALSRGGARKTYEHTDPNEDATAFYSGEGGGVVAVADGHWGSAASELAVERLLERHAPAWTGSEVRGLRALWPETARRAVADIHAAILNRFARAHGESSRTTLAFALVRPGDDLLAFASVGDSHVFCIDSAGAVDLARDPDVPAAYLGRPADSAESLANSCVVGTAGLAHTRAVLLVTDGISEPGIGVEAPARAVAEATERAHRVEIDLRPLDAARSVVELALAAHRRNAAGDNVASAVVWVED